MVHKNKYIIRSLKQLTDLMELHGEDPGKIKGMGAAINTLEQASIDLGTSSKEQLKSLKGIGDKMAGYIWDLAQKGETEGLNRYLEKTPSGILDLMGIKGIGIKKIRTAWTEAGIDTPDALLALAQAGRLEKLKGFGEKTQQQIIQVLEYYLANKGKLRYSDAEPVLAHLVEALQTAFPKAQISSTGAGRRKENIVGKLEWLVATDNKNAIRNWLDHQELLEPRPLEASPFAWRGIWTATDTAAIVHLCEPDQFARQLLLTTGSAAHLALPGPDQKGLRSLIDTGNFTSEKDFYQRLDWPWLVPELREGVVEQKFIKANEPVDLITDEDIRGVIHCHSTWSDGAFPLQTMAEACRDRGYHYLGITDHSQSAFYANGLRPDQVKKQFEEIDRLNEQMAPFRIFKGIESDILADGNLDYPDRLLAQFDFIIASVHSGLQMDIQKATARIIKAIQNPYTTILGHLTSRLLLVREGYPVAYQAIIDACAEHEVIIEINANPYRLDLDWRWVPYALDKGVMLSINPDAHDIDGLEHVQYGIHAGRKGGLTRDFTLNCRSMQEVQQIFGKKKNHG